MIRIIVADDHAMFRQGLMQLLKTVPGFALSGEAQNGLEACTIIETLEPDVAVLDVAMPEMTGIEVIHKVVRKNAGTRCVLLTMHDDPSLARQALDAGASGYVLKENAFDELVRAVSAVMKGEIYVSPNINLTMSSPQKLKKDCLLTVRESEILKWIASGLTNKEIANALYISVKTVDTHRTRILRKLNFHNTAEMVRYAVKNGLA